MNSYPRAAAGDHAELLRPGGASPRRCDFGTKLCPVADPDPGAGRPASEDARCLRRQDSSDAISALAAGLEERGIEGGYVRAACSVAVLSVRGGLTVWCLDGRVFQWHEAGVQVTKAVDEVGAIVLRLAELANADRAAAPVPRPGHREPPGPPVTE